MSVSYRLPVVSVQLGCVYVRMQVGGREKMRVYRVGGVPYVCCS